MQIVIADYSGFCFGVERALNITLEAAKKSSCTRTFGPLIHNPQVVKKLEELGILVVNSSSDVNSDMDIVIRSHGLEKNVREILSERAKSVTDATCPFVLKAQKMAHELSLECDCTVILGDKEHPEVKGLISYVLGECAVVADESEASMLPFRKFYGFLAQTTQNSKTFEKISAILESKCEMLKKANTICNATYNRQNASIALAREVDAMVVVGGRNSANTTRLYNLCKEICSKTYHVETVEEINRDMFLNVSKVGLTAGASTPKDFLRRVREYISEVCR